MRPPKFEVNVIKEIPRFNEGFIECQFSFHNLCAMWAVRVRKYVDDDDDTERIDARLFYEENSMNVKFKIFYSIKFLNNRMRAQKKTIVRDEIVDWKHYYPGDDLLMEEVLDRNSGYVENGVLKIQILFHMESIIVINENSMFNFKNPPFNGWEKGHTITFLPHGDKDRIYCHHQLIRLHCQTISKSYGDCSKNLGLSIPDYIQIRYFSRTLQILHGVLLDVKFDRDLSNILYFLQIARYFEMNNVTRFLERQLIETRSEDEFSRTLVLTAVEFKLEKLLKVMVKKCESKESLVRFLSVLVMKEKTYDPGIEEMSSEAMKTVVAKIFSLG
ncbi:unnamed protein product [Caenorhabditis brenneri]